MLLNSNEQKAMEVVKKMKRVESMTDPKDVLEYIRRVITKENVSYDVILDRCRTYEIIKSILDDMYPIFKEDLPKQVLAGKEKEEQIFLLTQMMMQF